MEFLLNIDLRALLQKSQAVTATSDCSSDFKIYINLPRHL